MKIKSLFFFIQLLLLILSKTSFAQIKFESINSGLSIGTISSNSPSFSTFGGKISSDFKLWFTDIVNFRIGFEHARSIEYFLFENRINKTYPLINYYFLSSFIKQNIYKKSFLEESVGIIILNDKTFSDRNYWEYGATFSITSGLDFRNSDKTGFSLSLGLNYGLTINATSVNFTLITFQINYFF
ncbi:MAG: hypothetical protein N2321_00875 [Melioribacteraceae bacterium]|nr:hypothetical protein [Melioribacteraceae bacterium]